MKCREVLEPGAIACVECGTRLDQLVEAANGTTIEANAPSSPTPPPNRNSLSYREDRNSRQFEASLTDSAMHGLGDVFGELFAQRGVGRAIMQPSMRTIVREETIVDGARQLPPASPAGKESMEQPAETKPGQTATNKQRVLDIFSIKGETLELIDNRLKAKTGADYLRRLTYLYLYAQEQHGRAPTPKADLIAVLKEAKIYDTNARTWLTKKIGFSVDSEDRLKLIAGAREQAVKTLDEALDTNVPDDWNPDTKTVRTRTPRKKA